VPAFLRQPCTFGSDLGHMLWAILCAVGRCIISFYLSPMIFSPVGRGISSVPRRFKRHRDHNPSAPTMRSPLIVKIRSQYGAPFIDLHRVDLQLSLYEKARELGVEFKFGALPEYRCTVRALGSAALSHSLSGSPHLWRMRVQLGCSGVNLPLWSPGDGN
jgi:hypothetical protein